MRIGTLATRTLVAAFVLFSSLTAGAAAPTCAPPADLSDGWSIEQDAASAGFDAARLCEAVQAFTASSRNLHGLLVERGGRLVAESYREGKDASTYTLVPASTRFEATTLHDVRSITKSVVSLLWGIAQAEGKTPPLDTPVLDLFPALAELKQDGRERITIEDLLAMRSGLDWREGASLRAWENDETGLLWRGDRARHVFDRGMAAPAGTRFNYNGGNTAVLGLLLAERTGMPLTDYARLKLFEPLGITDWEWVGDVRGRPRAYTGLRMRPRDLARIGRMLSDGGRWNGRQLVPGDWVRASLSPHRPSRYYGYQWWQGTVRANGKAYTWHGGLGNGGQRLFMMPALDLVVVTTAGEYNDGSIGRELTQLLSLVVAAVQGEGDATVNAPAAVGVAQAAPPAAAPVATRAVVQSVFEEDGGKRLYVRLKLLPRAKIPFSTITYRVRDRSLVAGLQQGANVSFQAQRIEGENTVIAIRAVAPCVRFQPCE